jgi:hypothetical protein
MLSAEQLLQMQREQFQHDKRNHSDISCLHKTDRLKHYGLHFAKYVGRIARGECEVKPVARTLVDTVLVSLSAANTLHQNFAKETLLCSSVNDPLRAYADAAGRFADACEKIDHLEEFTSIARNANADVMCLALCMADELGIDLPNEISRRRAELAERAFYISNK